MKSFKFLLTAALSICAATTSSAAVTVISNPALFTGSGAIDPIGDAEDVDANATGATAQATLEGRADFRTVQSFTGFTNGKGVGNENLISFTDPSVPDMRFRITSGNASGGAVTSTAALLTSSGNAVYLGSGALTSYLIEFGSYNTTTSTFTNNSFPVAAAGFTVSNFNATGTTITVLFLDSLGNTLSTQTAVGALETTTGGVGQEFYFGYDTGLAAGAGTISSISITSGTGVLGTNSAMDDLGFTVVPEPSSMLMGVMGIAAGFFRRRRVG